MYVRLTIHLMQCCRWNILLMACAYATCTAVDQVCKQLTLIFIQDKFKSGVGMFWYKSFMCLEFAYVLKKIESGLKVRVIKLQVISYM